MFIVLPFQKFARNVKCYYYSYLKGIECHSQYYSCGRIIDSQATYFKGSR